MRLNSETVQVLQKIFLQVFGKGELYLFGSRVDDARRGGDIDLYLVADNRDRMGEKRIEFLAQVKRQIGDQRIDLVLDRGAGRPIDKIAMREGLLPCQRH